MFLVAGIALVSLPGCSAQVNNAKTEIVKIYGNCGMCEKKIEEAAFEKKVAAADWDMNTKMATITYDSTKTTLNDVLKRIAYAGYDSDVFLAPEEVYNNLHHCCKYDRPTHEQVLDASVNPVIEAGNAEAVDEQVLETEEVNFMSALYDHYFNLKDALTKDDSKTAAAEASDMMKAIEAIQLDKMNAEQKSTWNKVAEELKIAVSKISSDTNLEKQRAQFDSISESIYTLMNVFKAEKTVYYMHCPMYNDGAGANWLSLESAIKNPYYGSAMLSCGSKKETLNP